MASEIISTTRWYETSTNNLTGATWTIGDSVYIDVTALILTNKAANGFSNAGLGTSGVIGTVLEAPDLAVSGDRLVVRLSASALQNASIRRLVAGTVL